MLINMLDGGLLDINSESFQTLGCITCNYGRCAVNNYQFIFTHCSIELHIENNDEDEYALTEADMMIIMLSCIKEIEKLKETEFEDFIKNKIQEKVKNKNCIIEVNIC